jgi:hypothetical protein
LFDQLGFAYIGSDAFACMLTLDKHLTKSTLAALGLATPRWAFVNALDGWHNPGLRFPLIIKPNTEDRSLGIGRHSVIECAEALRAGLELALGNYPAGVIVEEYVTGRDIEVPFLEGASPGTGGVLAACEYSVDETISDAVSVKAPADLSPALAQRLQTLATEVYRALGFRDLGRIDFRISNGGEPLFIEAYVFPSLEPGAGIYAAARLAGLGTVEQVLDAMIQNTLRRRVTRRPSADAFPIKSSSGKGRGVFAQRSYQPGELIERSPALVLSPAENQIIEQTVLDDYCFVWGENRDQAALLLGYGSLYNHSYDPNAVYIRRPELQEIHFVARRRIGPGEEIKINYNGLAESQDPLDFEVLP